MEKNETEQSQLVEENSSAVDNNQNNEKKVGYKGLFVFSIVTIISVFLVFVFLFLGPFLSGMDVRKSFEIAGCITLVLVVLFGAVEAILFFEARKTSKKFQEKMPKEIDRTVFFASLFLGVMFFVGVGAAISMLNNIDNGYSSEYLSEKVYKSSDLSPVYDEIDEGSNLEVLKYGDLLGMTCERETLYGQEKLYYEGFLPNDHFRCDVKFKDRVDFGNTQANYMKSMNMSYEMNGADSGGVSSKLASRNFSFNVEKNMIEIATRDWSVGENFADVIILSLYGEVLDPENAAIKVKDIYLNTGGNNKFYKKNSIWDVWTPVGQYDPYSVQEVEFKDFGKSSLYAYSRVNGYEYDFYKLIDGKYEKINTYDLGTPGDEVDFEKGEMKFSKEEEPDEEECSSRCYAFSVWSINFETLKETQIEGRTTHRSPEIIPND